MSNPVVKIALEGKSTNSTDPKDYSLHSDYNSIKIFKKGSSSQSVSGSSTADVSITHSVGFYPMCLLYVELTPGSNKWYAKPFTLVSGEYAYISDSTDYTYSNTSTLKFRIVNTDSSSRTIDYYYFVLGHSGK